MQLFNEAKNTKSKYWKNKPVVKLHEVVHGASQISSTSFLGETYKKDEYTKLPNGYTWNKIDVNASENMICIADFLTQHYKRGSDSSYVVQYDTERIYWEMNGKGYFLTILNPENKIIGLIGFTYRTVQILSNIYEVTEPMYMCCTKGYRNTGIAKVLMDETIRQSLLSDINKGVFCNNRITQKPIATLRQYSRPLNYKKLRENDFVNVQDIDEDVVHNKTKINLKPNRRYVFAEKNEKNVNIVHELYNRYMESFSFHMVLTKKDIENFMFNDKYVKTYLIMPDPNDEIKNDKAIDFVTYNFYDIINTQNKTSDNVIKVANILMYSSNSVRPDLIFINIMKQISFDKIQIVYLMDMMESNEIILSSIKNADEDTDDEEENATCDMNIIKTNKKVFINLFNLRCESFKQNMVSWLLF